MRSTRALVSGFVGGLATLLLCGHAAPLHSGAAAPSGPPRASAVPGAQDAPEQPGLAAPDTLTPLTRALLHERMVRHRDDMGALLRAVLSLRRPRIVELALQVADEPALARTWHDSDALNAALPARFFELEATMHQQARALAEAARQGRDDTALAQRFGRLTETCVSCHQAYQRAPAPR